MSLILTTISILAGRRPHANYIGGESNPHKLSITQVVTHLGILSARVIFREHFQVEANINRGFWEYGDFVCSAGNNVTLEIIKRDNQNYGNDNDEDSILGCWSHQLPFAVAFLEWQVNVFSRFNNYRLPSIYIQGKPVFNSRKNPRILRKQVLSLT